MVLIVLLSNYTERQWIGQTTCESLSSILKFFFIGCVSMSSVVGTGLLVGVIFNKIILC